MGKDTKLVFFQVVEGTKEDIDALGRALRGLKDKLPYDIEFLVGNEKVNLSDVKYLLKELYALYNKEKKLREDKPKAKKK